MDYIFIDEIEARIRIGCTIKERADPQKIRISAKIFLPLFEAGKTGRLDSTVDYADIISKVRTHVQNKEYVLLETLASEVAELILSDDNARAVQIEASKQILDGVKRTGVSIYRENI